MSRPRVSVLALVWLSGCGLTQDKFAEQYDERACEELKDCIEGAECLQVKMPDLCDFDRKQAKECLDADWTCDPDLGVVIPDPACQAVCGPAIEGDTDEGAE